MTKLSGFGGLLSKFFTCALLGGLLWGWGLLRPAPAVEPPTICAGSSEGRCVALTFDDGPSPRYTPQILALLRRYQAHGTFFVIGHKVEHYGRVVHSELQAGHEVGNHSYSHARLTKADQPCREQELERTAVDLDLAGCPQNFRLFRPPYSAYDARLASYLGHTGRRLVLWSLDSGDWRGLSAPEIVHNVLTQVRPGAIIIFHDSDELEKADRSPTVAALAVILPALKAADWRMVTVSELMAPHPAQPAK
jgi:peptidoglycan-N-acetylglucosamine deacetylase